MSAGQRLLDKPNVLIIYPDQMRFDAMSCAGNSQVKTPHIDRLALEGVRFERAYGSFPLCSPFRASLMTGKYAHSNGVYANHYRIPLNQPFIAQIFQENGYKTGYVGKWHLDGGVKFGYVPPERRLGFDYFAGYNRGHNYFNSIFYLGNDPQPYTSKRYEPKFQSDQMIDFMSDSVTCSRPFFAMINYGIPHPPLHAPKEFLNLYRPEQVRLRGNVPLDEDTQQKARDFSARYYGLVSALDHNIGKLLDWLEKSGQLDRTIVVLLSDHGELAGEHGLWGKKTFYEGSTRVPLMVRYPKLVDQAKIVKSVVDPSVDIMPTLLEMCDLPVPDCVQGKSLVPLLAGTRNRVREAVYYEILKEDEGPERFPIPERGLRTEKWLYVRTEKGPKVLFDTEQDPLELNNLLSCSEGYGEVIDQLDNLLTKHMQATGDSWAIEAKYPPEDFQTHKEGNEYRKALLDKAVVLP